MCEDGITEERIVNAKENDKILKRLMCSICLNMLWKPVACSQCQTNFCGSCIKGWLNKCPETCPNHCTFKKSNVSPIINDLLSEFSIKCQLSDKGCQQILGYDELEKHEKNCSYKETSRKGCKGCGQLFSGDVLIQHEKDCQLVKVTCGSCFNQFSKIEIKNHSESECWKKKYMSLMKICDGLKEENKKLAQKNEELIKGRADSVNRSIPNNNQITCPNQHKMESKAPSQRRYLSSTFGCNLCKKVINYASSWHCSACKYDICHSCRKPFYSKDLCLNNHLLTMSTRNIQCDKCGQSYHGVVRSCQSCEFDLCPNC